MNHRIALLLAASCLTASAASATEWRTLSLPEGTTGQWVLGDARVNGVPMQTQQLSSRLSAQQLLSYFEGQWKRWGAVQQGAQAGWQTLSVNTGPVQLTLQVKDRQGGGSSALLTQAAWPERQREFLPPELPNLPRTVPHQVTESLDGHRRSRLVQLASNDNLELNRQRWQAHARRKGWTLIMEKLVRQSDQQHWLASYSTANAHAVDIVLTQSSNGAETSITANFLDTAP